MRFNYHLGPFFPTSPSFPLTLISPVFYFPFPFSLLLKPRSSHRVWAHRWCWRSKTGLSQAKGWWMRLPALYSRPRSSPPSTITSTSTSHTGCLSRTWWPHCWICWTHQKRWKATNTSQLFRTYSTSFLYCERQETGGGLGMRQTTAASHILATHYNCMHKNQEVGGRRNKHLN